MASTTIKAAIFPFRETLREPQSKSAIFVDEDLTSIPAARIPDEFRKLSHFLPVIVLIPKSAVREQAAHKRPVAKKSVAALVSTSIHFPPPNPTDAIGFGDVTVSFSTMETRRKGQPVVLTRRQFKTLEYLIKNPRRVISREELLNKVWGYECYPCTRTVDNHILQLRKKLEADPAHPKHFHTAHGTGYKFLP